MSGAETAPGTDIQELIQTLDALAQQSRDALVQGHPFYEVQTDPLAITSGTKRTAHRVKGTLAFPGFCVERSLTKYGDRLGIDLLGFIGITTSGENQPIVLELGQGLGRGLRAIQKRMNERSRDIHCYGECDQFHFKLTTLLGDLLTATFKQKATKIYGNQLKNGGYSRIKREFVTILALYLARDPSLLKAIAENVDDIVRIAHKPETWKNLIACIKNGEIPDFIQEISLTTYQPSDQMRRLLEDFAENPETFFRTPRRKITANPKKRLDIASPNIILGGDMRSFVRYLPPDCINTVIGIRSTIYIIDEGSDIVPFGLEIARILKPGGGWIDDWPRGNYDADHYVGDAIALAKTLETQQPDTKLFLICGPSEEFPAVYNNIPIAAVIIKRTPEKDFEAIRQEIASHLITEMQRNGARKPVQYKIVTGDELPAMQATIELQRQNDPLTDVRKETNRKLRAALADTKA